MKHATSLFLTVLLLSALCAAAHAAEPLLSVSFAEKAWDPAAWTLCRNPTVDYLGKWVQHDTYVENETPADPAKRSALEGSLTTMVYTTKFTGDYTVAATLQIGAGAAPGIIIAQDLTTDDKGRPQYGEFYECIIYEKGLNLWHHFARDGKRTYEKTSWSDFALKPDTPYKFEVHKKGKSLLLSVDGNDVGVLIQTLPDELYLGVEGCEGICRAYDFSVTR